MIDAGRINAIDSHQPVRSILIVLIAGIGDVVLASASFRAIRNGYPDAEIHLLTSTEAVPLAVNYPYIDHVHAFPIRELRKSKKYLFDMMRIVRDLRQRGYDMLINLYQVGSFTGAAKMGFLFSLLRAKERIGHAGYGFGAFLDRSVSRGTFTNRHVVDAMMMIATLAGGIGDEKGIEVFWNEHVAPKWERFLATLEKSPLIGINPGGDRENRRWHPDNFVAVAKEIMERFNAGIILLGGPADKSIAWYISNKIGGDVTNLSGEIPLDELPFLIGRLDLLITNDSGPMHIAAATKTPLIALFGPEDPELFGPYTEPEQYRILHKNPNDNHDGKKRWRPTSVNLITTEEVLAAAAQLLGSRYRH